MHLTGALPHLVELSHAQSEVGVLSQDVYTTQIVVKQSLKLPKQYFPVTLDKGAQIDMQRSSIKSSAAKLKTPPVPLCLAKDKLKYADMKKVICEHSHDSYLCQKTGPSVMKDRSRRSNLERGCFSVVKIQIFNPDGKSFCHMKNSILPRNSAKQWREEQATQFEIQLLHGINY